MVTFEEAMRFLPLVTTPMGAWLGWWLRGRTDKRNERKALIETIGNEYLTLMETHCQDSNEGHRLYCLQRAGMLRLTEPDHLVELGLYIAAHGHIDPVAARSEWLELTQLDLPGFLKWASEFQIALRDELAVYEAVKNRHLDATALKR